MKFKSNARAKLENLRIIWYNNLNLIRSKESFPKGYSQVTKVRIREGGRQMAISYKRLWKLLIDRDLKKKDLQAMAGISAASITKLGKNENVNTEIIEKICHALQCDFSDIMELTKDEHDQEADVVK